MPDIGKMMAALTADGIAAKREIAFSVYDQDLLPENANASQLFVGGNNIKPTAMACDFANFVNKFKHARTEAFYRKCVQFLGATASYEGLSQHYSEYRYRFLLALAALCDALGWTAEAAALRKQLEYLVALHALFAVPERLGLIPAADQHPGPMVLHCNQTPTGIGAASLIAGGPRSERRHRAPEQWYYIGNQPVGACLSTILSGAIHRNDEMALALKKRGWRYDYAPQATLDLARRAVRNDVAALQQILPLAKFAIVGAFSFEVGRGPGGVWYRTLADSGGNVNKGPHAAFVAYAPKAGGWREARLLVGTGDPNWLAFVTTRVGRAVSCSWPDGGNGKPAMFAVDLPPGEDTFRLKVEKGVVTEAFPGEGQIPAPEPIPADDEQPPVTTDAVAAAVAKFVGSPPYGLAAVWADLTKTPPGPGGDGNGFAPVVGWPSLIAWCKGNAGDPFSLEVGFVEPERGRYRLLAEGDRDGVAALYYNPDGSPGMDWRDLAWSDGESGEMRRTGYVIYPRDGNRQMTFDSVARCVPSPPKLGGVRAYTIAHLMGQNVVDREDFVDECFGDRGAIPYSQFRTEEGSPPDGEGGHFICRSVATSLSKLKPAVAWTMTPDGKIRMISTHPSLPVPDSSVRDAPRPLIAAPPPKKENKWTGWL